MKFKVGDRIVYKTELSEIIGYEEAGHLTRYVCKYLKPFLFKHCYGEIQYEVGDVWTQFTETVDKYYKLIPKSK